VGAELLRADRWTEKQTDMIKRNSCKHA